MPQGPRHDAYWSAVNPRPGPPQRAPRPERKKMKPLTGSVFDLPDRLAAKADPALIAVDEAALRRDRRRASSSRSPTSRPRLDAARAQPGGTGQAALDRDLEIHRLTARLRTLRRFGLDLCLGHIVDADDPEPVYIGRLGLTDSAGRRLLVDWRSPAAEPFFGATHGDPMGLASRRRYRWTGGRISDYWDEVFTPDGLEGRAALDDQSAFIASLGGSRSSRMRDVLATIQADQDAIIRAGSRGALVVDGGPGTGKTVVALHRSAYLLYSDPRLGSPPRRRAVRRTAPALPRLRRRHPAGPRRGGRRDLHAARPRARGRRRPRPRPTTVVARLKASAALVGRSSRRSGIYEQPPTRGHDRRDAVGAMSGSAPTTGPRRSRRPSPGPRTTRRATRCSEALLDDPRRQARGGRPRRPPASRAARRTRSSCAR